MRIRSVLALLLAGMLLAAGVASAQSTTTEPTSGYTTTEPTSGYTNTTTTPTTTSEVGGETESNGNAPAVSAQPAAEAPSSLAFTGAEPLLLIALGLGLAGATTALLVRDRRRANQER